MCAALAGSFATVCPQLYATSKRGAIVVALVCDQAKDLALRSLGNT